VINYFMPNPSVIAAGGSTTLGWDVSNATSVTIDNGVGSVGATGTTVVSPATSTNYTLTAANAVGMYYMTITVLVTGAPAAGQPDLIIEDISHSGDKVSYKIKNQGDATAGPSTSTLLVDGATVANDSVGSLAAGESKTETFTGYTYSCTLPGDAMVVKADTSNAVVESSEANNSYSKSWSCLLIVEPRFTLKPDLVIENLWLVHEATGDKIYYKIKNNGSIAAGASTSALYIYPCVAPCSPKATDSVASLAAGESRTEKFAAYNYTGLGWSVGVTADYNDAINESDEGNNSLDKAKGGL
jgi:subtilase family serine protease